MDLVFGLRTYPPTYEEFLDEKLRRLRLTGATRNVILRLVRETGRRDFDILLALTGYATDRYSFLRSLSAAVTADLVYRESSPRANGANAEAWEGSYLRLCILTKPDTTASPFEPALIQGLCPAARRISFVAAAGLGNTEGVARDVLFKVRRRREARVTHCLAEEHRGFVERFVERGERAAKEEAGEKGGGKSVENAERAVFNVERAAERMRRALRNKEGVFALGRTEGAKREMKVIGKAKGKGSGNAGGVERKGKGRVAGETRDVDEKGKWSEAKGVERKGKGREAEEVVRNGKGREEPVEESEQENNVGGKPEKQRVEPEVKKPTYAMMLREGESSRSNAQEWL